MNTTAAMLLDLMVTEHVTRHGGHSVALGRGGYTTINVRTFPSPYDPPNTFRLALSPKDGEEWPYGEPQEMEYMVTVKNIREEE